MSTTLDRKFLVDVTNDLTLAAGFLRVAGVEMFAPDNAPTIQDTTASDTSGSSTGEVTLYTSTATMTIFRRIVAGVYDPAQELIRTATLLKFGTAARIGMRWYDKDGGPETGKGIYIPKWTRTNSGVPNVEKVSLTFTNTDAAPTLDFTNPGTAPVAPVIYAATPTAQSVGKILTIIGNGFSGTTGASSVTIGGTNATNYIVQSDTVITAVVPAGSAGAAAIVVTNLVGASNSFAYTRGA